MDTRKLAAFVDLAHTLNYSQTAARLFTTQATISKQIIALEKELETPLFIRAHRQVTLTEAGQAILPLAQQLLTTEHQLAATLDELQQSHQMHLIIHTIPSISQYQAFNLIAAFNHQFPHVNLQFAEAETAGLLPSLDDGSSDIVFLRSFQKTLPGYEQVVTDTDHWVAVLPEDHPLAQQAVINLHALRNESFLLLDESTHLFQPVIDLAHAAGFSPHVLYKGERIDLIMGMVNRGLGVSVMMRHAVDHDYFSHTVTIPIDATGVSYLSFVRKPSDHTQASNLFWHFITQQF